MLFEPLKEISWAYQLHYHLCFRTHRRRPFLDDPLRGSALSRLLRELCEANGFHLLEERHEPRHVQPLVSLRPNQIIAHVLKTLKGRSSTSLCRDYELVPPVWARGYLARSAGRVRIQQVKDYIERQAQHHGYDNRKYSPVFRCRQREHQILATAHASFELSHHLVLATRMRRGGFDRSSGEALVKYWLKVGYKHWFLLDQATVLPDHVHLLIGITPKISIEQAALALMNNGLYLISKHFSESLIKTRVDQLWEPSAYAGTCGELTTGLLQAFLKQD